MMVLNLRGRNHNILGPMKEIISSLISNVEFSDMERFSNLSYSGYKKIQDLIEK